MADKKEHRSYMDVELNQGKQTLAKSIEKEMRLKKLNKSSWAREDYSDNFSQPLSIFLLF
jgi:hypothetical protein